ncbi:hypothetical protein ACOSQ4_021636 [Xanthoceras sorbifolium]
MLQQIECDYEKYIWEGDLNTTIQRMYKELYILIFILSALLGRWHLSDSFYMFIIWAWILQPFHASRLVDESASPNGGLFGTAVAAMEMLSTAAYLLMTMDLSRRAYIEVCIMCRFCLFRILGYYTGHPLLGAKVVANLVIFVKLFAILMALFVNTAGGAWDNAKKYLETGALGGKGSDTNKAAFTGETDGDSFKGTAESSLHVRIKIVATITLVMAPIVL